MDLRVSLHEGMDLLGILKPGQIVSLVQLSLAILERDEHMRNRID
jgi:hypothetical protein